MQKKRCLINWEKNTSNFLKGQAMKYEEQTHLFSNFLSVLFSSETGSHYVVQAGFELVILLTQSPKD
jgi:hypothetical protein